MPLTVDDILKAAEEGKRIANEIRESKQTIRAYVYCYITKSDEPWSVWAERLNMTENELRYWCYVAPIELVPEQFYHNVQRVFNWNEPKR